MVFNITIVLDICPCCFNLKLRQSKIIKKFREMGIKQSSRVPTCHCKGNRIAEMEQARPIS